MRTKIIDHPNIRYDTTCERIQNSLISLCWIRHPNVLPIHVFKAIQKKTEQKKVTDV